MQGFNWSILLSTTDAATWDELAFRLKQETGRRALAKSDIFRALLTLTNDETVRAKLVDALRSTND